MQRDVDYVVKDGRGAHRRRASPDVSCPADAIQTVCIRQSKRRKTCKIERENKTQATITFQNYFRMYKKLSGMTGTALTEETEFREIYSLDVVEIPTNKPVMRT